MAKIQQAESLRRSFSRFTRLGNQLMRGQCSCGPVTIQQYYTLEALADGRRSMSDLASQVGVHQSTMTRIVEKLGKQALVRRERQPGNERCVEVEITEKGKEAYLPMKEWSTHMFSSLLDHIPKNEQGSVVATMELLTDLFSPENEVFQDMHRNCCTGGDADCCNTSEKQESKAEDKK
ncbi:MAG: MarR family transcriptional regulator [Lentisphaerae bacterium]|nr:MarR family transcriptional regulator [Lentisphaerota bacterium]